MPSNDANAWLARDADGEYYAFDNLGPKPVRPHGAWYQPGHDDGLEMGMAVDEDSVHADLRLDPGDGPIPVRITIEPASKEGA